MAAEHTDDISVVVPTYHRARALERNLANHLALRGVAEVIVVDDGSPDDTQVVLSGFADERLKVIRHAGNRGVAAARNTGLDAATGAWVLFGEDDCRMPREYATVLRAEALRHGADIVGAPWLHITGTDTDAAEAATRAPRVDSFPMDAVSAFPRSAITTPFLPARVLMSRRVFEQLRFDEGYPVNAYREETDFFIQAARAGFRCILTPETFCYQLQGWPGGTHDSSRLQYEYWVLRNNWRFLARHGSWLAGQGYIRGPARAQLSFATRRASVVARGAAGARLARLRRAAA